MLDLFSGRNDPPILNLLSDGADFCSDLGRWCTIWDTWETGKSEEKKKGNYLHI